MQSRQQSTALGISPQPAPHFPLVQRINRMHQLKQTQGTSEMSHHLDSQELSAEAPSTPAPVVKPKRPLSAYSLYFRDQRERIANLKKQDPSLRGTSVAVLVSQFWKNISPSVRARYDQLAAEDKFRHYVEKMEYKVYLERLKEARQEPPPEKAHDEVPLPIDADSRGLNEIDALFLMNALS